MADPSQPAPPKPPRAAPGSRLGIDVGATLAKLAIGGGEGRVDHRLVPAHGIERLAREVESLSPERVGLTGGGALALARRLSLDTTQVNEFEAWGAGSHALLRAEGRETGEPHLLVSLGTGTSALRVEGASVVRVGGTALGGGTLVGLGAALTGEGEFDALLALAREGDRRRVDLLVSDLYSVGDLPLPGGLTASSFAKLAGPRLEGKPAARDLAHALIGLVGENVGLICAALASAAGVRRIVFGGSTLRGNEPLMAILRGVCVVRGHEAIFPAHGEFTGAVGALAAVSR